MFSISELQSFFERYRSNLEEEKRINLALLSADNQDEWWENLQKKNVLFQNLFDDNEQLLDRYLRPLLNGEKLCPPEVANYLLDEIERFNDDDMEDDFCFAETLHYLIRYFETNSDTDRLILSLHLLGGYYNRLFDPKEGEFSAECFNRIRSLKDHYFVTESRQIRRCIFESFYNYPLVCGNWELVPLDDLVGFYEEACLFMDDPKVRELEADTEYIENLRKELDYDILGNPIQARDSVPPLFLSKAIAVLKTLYENYLAENPNPHAMPDEIYLNYFTARFIAGEISRHDYTAAYKEYCDWVFDNPDEALDEDTPFYSSRLFQVYMSHLGWLLHLLKHEDCDIPDKENMRREYMQRFIKYVSGLPKDEYSGFVNGIILYTLKEMLSNSDDPLLDIHFILNVTVCRDANLLLHAIIAKKLSQALVNAIIQEKPDLLVGTLGCSDVMDVLGKRREILDYIGDAAQIYDFGKIYIPQIVGKYTRSLTSRELRMLRRYPERGWEPFSKSSQMLPFRDIIMGHKRSYDGKSGYPEQFDILNSSERRSISIISICDYLIEGTSPIKTSRFKDVSFAQLIDTIHSGAGTIYDPELAEWLCGNKPLCHQLETLCTTGRARVCYEAYRDFVSGISYETKGEKLETSSQVIRSEKEEKLLNKRILHVLARASMYMMKLHIPSGKYTILYRWDNDDIEEEPTGDIRQRVEYFREHIFQDDWRSFYELIEPATLSKKLMDGHGEAELEYRRIDRNGEFRWTRLQCSLLDERNGKPEDVLFIFKDIDEARKETEQVQEAMQTAYKNAEAANIEKSRFLSSMSHDIRTPMNVILGMTRLAKKHINEPDRALEYLDKINNTSNNLLELINQVLDMSKIESGSLELNMQPVNLNKLVDRIKTEISTLAKDRSHNFVVEIKRLQHANVLTDSVRISQVLQNLLSNAVKYTPDGGEIEFQVEELNCNRTGFGAYRFTVKDNGIGMSEEFQENLFKPFSREETELTQQVTGTGLGMSIIRQVINAMSGNIEVKSTQGQGTEITVILSFAIDYEADEKEEEEVTTASLPDLCGKHIFLVEDNPLNREIAYEILKETGADITIACDGVECVEKFLETPENAVDLILMDIQMPRMNGYETSKAIRALDRADAPHVPIVAMTADVFTQDVTEALQCGMNGHLAKPIELSKLYHVLRSLT